MNCEQFGLVSHEAFAATGGLGFREGDHSCRGCSDDQHVRQVVVLASLRDVHGRRIVAQHALDD